MLQALFFDLDGTLLTSDKKLLPSTRAALRQCRDQGVRVFLATARSPRLNKTLHWSQEDLALFDGGIYSNGACILLTGQLRYVYIDPAAVQGCLQQLKDYPGVLLSLHMEGDQHAYNYPVSDEMLALHGIARRDILPLDDSAARHAVKMLIYTDPRPGHAQPLPAALYPALQAACGHASRLYLTDGGCTIQVAGLNVSKQAGIEQVCRQLGIGAGEIAVFGDDLNDMEMLTHCPNSIAMGNAHPQLKAIAAHITRSNDEDGIAHALKDILHII